ncbi:MAG: L,D-transpeptidase family protein [Thermotogota bacterium]
MNGVLLPLQPPEIPYHEEHIANHQVLPGEYLYKLAVEYGVDRADLELLNKDKVNGVHTGDELIIGSVSFEDGPYEILISLKYCRLTLFYEEREIISFPVAVGSGQRTPEGIYYIKRKVEDPALYWEGEYIQPLSPINGLGKWWLELSNPQYGIHGTNKPWEIGKRISHGCIRMFNEDVSLLQSLVPVGTRVIIKE